MGKICFLPSPCIHVSSHVRSATALAQARTAARVGRHTDTARILWVWRILHGYSICEPVTDTAWILDLRVANTAWILCGWQILHGYSAGDRTVRILCGWRILYGYSAGDRYCTNTLRVANTARILCRWRILHGYSAGDRYCTDTLRATDTARILQYVISGGKNYLVSFTGWNIATVNFITNVFARKYAPVGINVFARKYAPVGTNVFERKYAPVGTNVFAR